MIKLAVFLSICIAAVIGGLDYVAEVNLRNDVAEGRFKAVQWLLSKRNENWGWGTESFPETHRMLTALHLSGELQNETESLEYQLSVKQLELELSLGLLRKDDVLSAGQLGLYINALLATCRSPSNFYGHNIVEKMKNAKNTSLYMDALVLLAYTNSGNPLKKTEFVYYFDMLDKYSPEYTHGVDSIAMVVLALSSAAKNYRNPHFIDMYLRGPLNAFKKMQKSDGSFGNIYTSALVMQALIGYGDKGDGWSFEKGIDYLLSQQGEDGSFIDLLSAYFSLPVLAGRSLVNLRNVTCQTRRTSLEGNESWRESIMVRYSIWGNEIISELFAVPQNSTFLDVMKVAQNFSDDYRFSGTESSWGFYVTCIGNISNDEYCGRYWFLYKINRDSGALEQTLNGVSKEMPQDGDHYVFVYKQYEEFSGNKNNTKCISDDLPTTNTTTETDVDDLPTTNATTDVDFDVE